MSTRRWFAVVAVGTLLIAGGLVWMFLALGPDHADQISSGIGAGAAVLGVAIAVAGVVGSRSQPGQPPTAGQSVQTSTINGPNIQVGGSITGTVHTERGDEGEPAR